MPTIYKVLGQSAPAATTNTNLYTVPSLTNAVISSIVVASRVGTAAAFRIAIRPGGAAIADQHYIAYDVTVGAGDSTTLTLGITLAATDIITVYASNSSLSFNVFGSEITA